jgi:hypothetical protein
MRLVTTLRRHQKVLLRLSWSNDGSLLAAASADRQVHVWDWERMTRVVRLGPHGQGVNQAEWSPDGTLLASCSADGQVRLWDARTWAAVPPFDLGGDLRCLAWSLDGRTLVVGSDKGLLKILDLQTRRVVRTVNLNFGIDGLAWSTGRRLLAACCRNGSISIFRGNDWTVEREISNHSRDVLNAAWSPDDRYLVSASKDHTVVVTPLDGTQPVVLRDARGTVRSVSYSGGGQLLAANSLDGTVRLYRTQQWTPVAEFAEPPGDYWPPTIAFHPTRPVLATLGDRDKVVRIWDVADLIGSDAEPVRAAAPVAPPQPVVQSAQPSAVFVSYAHADNASANRDERWLDRLLEMLAPLRNHVSVYSDQQLQTGLWHRQIQAQLESAKVAVLLISPGFLASSYIRDHELPVLLRRATEDRLVLLPLIVRRTPVSYLTFKYPDPVAGPQEIALSDFQGANSPERPLNALQPWEQDDVLANLAERLRSMVESWRSP